MKHTSKKPPFRVLAWLVGILLGLFSILTIATGILHQMVLLPDYYSTHILKEQNITGIVEKVQDDIAMECRRFAFPEEELTDAVNWDSIRATTESYVHRYFDTLFSGAEMDETLVAVYDKSIILSEIRSYAANAEDPGIYGEDENCVLLADRLAEKINGDIGILSQKTILSVCNRLSLYLPTMGKFASLFFVFLAGAILLLIGYCVLAGVRHSPGMIYGVALMQFFIGVLFFIPSLLIYLFALPEHIVLGYGILRFYFAGIWSSIFFDLSITFGIYSGLALAGVIVGIVLIQKQKRKVC